jgi:hypothetical protein
MQKSGTLIEDNSSPLEDVKSPLDTNPIYSGKSKLLNLLSNYVKEQSLQQENKTRS